MGVMFWGYWGLYVGVKWGLCGGVTGGYMLGLSGGYVLELSGDICWGYVFWLMWH